MVDGARWMQAGRWLLRREAHGCDNASNLTVAAAGILRQLDQRLAVLVGPLGARTLTARALQVAQAEYPFLCMIEVGPGAAFEGLRESIVGVDPAAACDGLAAVFAETMRLLGDMAGADIAVREARRMWPEMPAAELLPAAEVERA